MLPDITPCRVSNKMNSLNAEVIHQRQGVIHQHGHIQRLVSAGHLCLAMATHVHSDDTIVATQGRNPGAKTFCVGHRAMQHQNRRGVLPHVSKVIDKEIELQSLMLERVFHKISLVNVNARTFNHNLPVADHFFHLYLVFPGGIAD